MKVPFLELKPAYDELREMFDAAYHRVMDSGWYLLGEELDGFEREYAEYCGTSSCVGVGSGLDALTLSLRACGIGPGDEVIVPAHTFIATWLAVAAVGATPKPVEPDLSTYNIDPTKIEDAITESTRAIIPVHLYGQPADMSTIMEIAERRNLYVIEDSAQAQGARFEGRRTGGLGHIAAHSFYPGKNLGAFSDGGAITTDESELADRVRLLRNYGSRKKYHYELAGVNSRLDELQAAFLRIRLAHLDEWNKRRQTYAGLYAEVLGKSESLTLPKVPESTEPVWHLYVIGTSHRDVIQAILAEAEIGTQIHYPIPAHLSPAFREMNATFPLTETLSKSILSLPIGPHLTESQVQYSAETLASICK